MKLNFQQKNNFQVKNSKLQKTEKKEAFKNTISPSITDQAKTEEIKVNRKKLILPNQNYQLEPCRNKLLQLQEFQLKKVKNFQISNEFGKIDWVGYTDVLNQNLKRDVSIKRGKIEVYPDSFYQKTITKPRIGQKLNKECILTFYQIQKPEIMSIRQFKDLLTKQCIIQEAEFLEYNSQKNELKIKVQHFTKYAFLDDIEDEEESEEESAIFELIEDSHENQQESENINNREFSQEKIKSDANSQNFKIQNLNKESFFENQLILMTEEPQKNKKIINNQFQIQNLNIKKTEEQTLMNNSQEIQFNSEIKPFEGILTKEQIENDFEIIKKELEALNAQANLPSILQKSLNKKNSVGKDFAVINKIFQSDRITKKSAKFSKDIEFPICFINDNDFLTIDKKFINNTMNIFTTSGFEVNQNQYKIFRDIVNNLLIELLQFFITEKKLINETCQILNSLNIKRYNEQDIFKILFILNLQQKLEENSHGFWYLYIKLIALVFMDPFFKVYNDYSQNLNYTAQLKEIVKFYEINQGQTDFALKQQFSRGVFVWCEIAIDFLKKLYQKESINPDFFNFQYNFDVCLNIEEEFQDQQSFIENSFISKFRQILKNEFDLGVLESYIQLRTEQIQNQDILNQLFYNVFQIYQVLVENQNPVENFIIVNKHFKSNRTSHFFLHLFLESVAFEKLNSRNNAFFKKQYQWNFQNLEHFLVQNEFYLIMIILSNELLNSNFINQKRIYDSNKMKYFKKVIGHQKYYHILKQLFGIEQTNDILCEQYLDNNKINEYLEMEQNKEKSLQTFLEKILVPLLNCQKKNSNSKILEILNLWEFHFNSQNDQLPFSVVKYYILFQEKVIQHNLKQMFVLFREFIWRMNQTKILRNTFFKQNEEILREIQSQMLAELISVYQDQKNESQDLIQFLNSIQNEELQFYISEQHLQKLGKEILKLNQ